MTVKMSSEGDSSKNLSSESNEKSEAENTDSSQDVKETLPEKPSENSIEKKEEEPKSNEASKTSADEPDKKPENDKEAADKSENSKPDVKPVEKKEEKAQNNEEEEEEEENSEKDGDDSEKGDDDEDKEVPLLDQPLEKSGKRERKNVQRFNEEFSSDSKDKDVKVEIPAGTGTALGNIPRIDASISRFKNEDMRVFHRILFKTPGKSTMVKKNIKKFNGFDFKKDSEEYSKKVQVLQKCEVKQLKSICEMLDLFKSGTKDDIVERILDFLMEPRDSGKPVGGGRPKRTAAVRANNRGYSSHDNYSSDERHSGRSGRDKGKRANLKDDSSSASDEDFEPSDEGSDEKPRVTKRKRPERKKVDSDEDDDDVSDVESASSEDSDFQDEPKNKRKKSVKTNNKAKGKTPGKRGRKPAAAKRGPKGGKKKKESSEEEEEDESDHKEEEEEEEEGSSSEDEPLAKKAKSAQPPTDDEIKTYVKEILEGANLEQITMKTVCQQVYAHYPDFDLAHKKDFIKSTVKSLIST